jgi:hypothetical protein
VKDYDDAVRRASETYGYTKKRILADNIVTEIEAEDGDAFQQYEFADGGRVPAGTPIGVEIFDFSQDDEATLFLYDHIRCAG